MKHDAHINGMPIAEVMERVMANIEEEGDCWKWQLFCLRGLYPMTSVGGQSFRTRRVVYLCMRGPIPKGLEVITACGCPQCVNPAHLALATRSTRMKQVAANRTPDSYVRAALKHSRPNRKLTMADVREIRASDESSSALAARMGCSPSLVRNTRRHEVHRELTSPWAGLMPSEGARA